MKRNQTAIILIHEIYGINKHIEHMKKKLSTLGFDVYCPNLINRDQPYPYKEETIAYQNFVQNVGWEYGVQIVNQMIGELKQQYQKVGVIGFSVGATIAWLCSENRMCDFVVGCYGSRIRNHTDINPSCPTLLIFPTEEKAFNVKELVEILEKTKNDTLTIKSFLGSHGFMDPFSRNYNGISARDALECVGNFLSENIKWKMRKF